MNIWWNENSDTRFFLEVDVQYPESLQSYKLTRKTFTMTTWKNENQKVQKPATGHHSSDFPPILKGGVGVNFDYLPGGANLAN